MHTFTQSQNHITLICLETYEHYFPCELRFCKLRPKFWECVLLENTNSVRIRSQQWNLLQSQPACLKSNLSKRLKEYGFADGGNAESNSLHWSSNSYYIEPVCNRPECAVFLPEETPNWKSGSGKMLQEEALLIAEKLGISGFTASNEWLQRFKQHYNLQKMANAGEDGDVSEETLESWNERVREITRGWSPENVWNTDETGSFWRGLPDTSLNGKGRRRRGGKQAKQRHTWAFLLMLRVKRRILLSSENMQNRVASII